MEEISQQILAQVNSIKKAQLANLIIIANVFTYEAAEIDKERLIRTAISTLSPNGKTISSNSITKSCIDEAFILRISGILLSLIGVLVFFALNETKPATNCITAKSKKSTHLAIVLVLLAIIIRISDLIFVQNASNEAAKLEQL